MSSPIPPPPGSPTPSDLPSSAEPHLRSARPTLTVVLTTVAFGTLAFGELRGAEPPTPAPPASSPSAVLAPGQQATATELTAAIRKALALIVKRLDAKTGADRSRQTLRARAFRTALAEAAAQTDAFAAALGSKEKTAELFPAMRRVGVSLAALQVTFRYGGLDDDQAIDNGFRKAAAAYGVLRRNYGRDLLAPTSESETTLSATQKEAFDALKARAASFAKQLMAMQPSLKENPAAAFETETLLRALTGLDKTRRDRRDFLNALAVAELALGRWNGLKLFIAAVYPPDAAKLAPAGEAAAGYETVLGQAGEAAFGGGNEASVYDLPAEYSEDLAVEGIGDPEVSALLQTLRTAPAPTPGASGGTSDETNRAADRETNAADPDDDTSLDLSGDEGPAENGND